MKTSYQYLKENIAKLREQIASLEAENNRLYQQACKAEEELLKYKAEPSKVHGSYERIIICDEPKPKPVYVPFTFADAEQLIGKAVKEKTHGVFGIVTWVLHDCVEIGSDTITFSALFDWYTFLDGTPCGKELK